jgi:tetratricopeptide (TPR) repeat protein
MRKLAVTIGGILWLACLASARADVPLYEEDPYDLITLNAANKNEVVKVKRLDLPDRMHPPAPGKAVGKLTVQLVSDSEKQFEVDWRSIVKFETFEQLVLGKARSLAAEKQFDAAYDCFLFLQQNAPNLPDLGNAVDEFLFAEASFSQQRRQYDGALALLRELHARNPRWPNIGKALGLATDELVKRYVDEQNYSAARVLLHNLAVDFPDHPVAIEWRNRFIRQAEPLLSGARSAAAAGRWHEAGSQIRQVGEIWPDLAGARELAATIHQQCPRVVVGVTSSAGAAAVASAAHSNDWAARRMERLLVRTLTEYIGSGTEGGRYDCPVGKIAYDPNRRRLAIRLKPNVGWAAGNATLCNSDVARRLLAMAEPGENDYRVDWAELLNAVSIRGVYDVEVELRRPHVRPEALLQIILTPQGAPVDAALPSNGPFFALSRGPTETVFVANERYFAAVSGRPTELVERRYPTVAKAIAALKRGDILAVDRINPWNVAPLQDDIHLIVQPYALPLMHCLIPNVRRPFVSDRTFRRALVYGIDREAILAQMLGGAKIPGCVVSGSPFPLGVTSDDPLGYGSDTMEIQLRPYEPRLAIAMAGTVVLSGARKDAPAKAESPKNELPKTDADQNEPAKAQTPKPAKSRKKAAIKLVLAYPADEIATAACMTIRWQLKRMNIEVELRPIAGPMPSKVPDDVDLMYAELPMWEPLVDARRLLGEDGMTGGCSPYMKLALRQLDEAVDWREARECLHRIHRLAYNDTAIVPLWQLVDHFVYRDSLRGVAERPVSFYQSVEQWRPPFFYPKEP